MAKFSCMFFCNCTNYILQTFFASCGMQNSNTLGPCDLCRCSWSTTVYDLSLFCVLIVWLSCRSRRTDGLHFCSKHTVFLILLGVFLLACKMATCLGYFSLHCVWVGFWWSTSTVLLTGVESPSPASYHQFTLSPCCRRISNFPFIELCHDQERSTDRSLIYFKHDVKVCYNNWFKSAKNTNRTI